MKLHGMRWPKIAGLALGISGCNAIAGINPGTPRGEGGAGGGSQTTGAGGSTMFCTPLTEKKPCYTGSAATEGKGTCKSGQTTCNAEGSAFGPCLDQVLPMPADDCANKTDTTCDDKVSCPCTPNETIGCTSAQPGVCADGTRVCDADGKSYGACISKLTPSFEDCFTPEDEDCDGKAAVACLGTPGLAIASLVSTGDDSVFGVATDAAGNIFIGGVSGSSAGSKYDVSFGAAEIAMFDKATGKLIWKNSFPATGAGSYSVVRAVTVDGMGNVIIIGEYQGALSANGVTLFNAHGNAPDVFVIKLAANGSLQWQKSFGDVGRQVGAGITAVKNGDVFLIGTMDATMSFGNDALDANAGENVFVARLDGATGEPKWGKSFGSNSDQIGWDIAAMSDESVVVTGQTQGEGISFGGEYVGAGGGNDKDIFLAKLDGNGNYVWSKAFGDVYTDQVGYSVAIDSKDNIVITGYAIGSTNFGDGPLTNNGSAWGDLFVASFTSDGAHRWSNLFGDVNRQEGRDVAVDAAGNVLVTGYFAGSLKFDDKTTLTSSGTVDSLDGFVAKFEGLHGTFVWARSFGDAPNDQLGWSITADPSANVIVGGTFKGTLDFGPTTTALTSQNNSFDSFWAKLAP